MKTKYLLGAALVIGSQLSGSSAFAARPNLICSIAGRSSVSISISLNAPVIAQAVAGTFEYSESYSGSFPTHDEFAGTTSGRLAYSDQGIEARFDFIAFGVASQLDVHQSMGRVTIGDDVSQNLVCVLN